MAQDADLEFGDEPVEELAVTDEPTAEPEQPIGQERAPATEPIDLSKLPEFRKWQADADRRNEQLRQENERMRREYEAALASQTQAQLKGLYAQLDEVEDVRQREQVVEQIAAARFREYTEQQRRWNDYVTERAKAEGLEADKYLKATYQSREQFEAELLQDSIKNLKKQLQETQEKASPAAARKMVAQAAHEAGYDAIDAGTPTLGGNWEAWERDRQAVQAGRMTPNEYLKRWEGKTPS